MAARVEKSHVPPRKPYTAQVVNSLVNPYVAGVVDPYVAQALPGIVTQELYEADMAIDLNVPL